MVESGGLNNTNQHNAYLVTIIIRQKDVGRPKATVAAEFVTQRVPGVNIVPCVYIFSV